MNATPLGGDACIAALPGFSELVTILSATTVHDEYAHDAATWAPVAALTDLPAAVSRLARANSEVERGSATSLHELRAVVLASYHPEIAPETHRLRWNGDDWRITTCLCDSTHSVTSLIVERVVPGV